VLVVHLVMPRVAVKRRREAEVYVS